MNFDHVNKMSDFYREKMLPHLRSQLHVTDFGNYLSRMCETPSGKWLKTDLKAFPLSYCINPVEFAKKYVKKCVTFLGTSNPQDGNLLIIYQITPTLHVLARLYQWIEHDGEVRAYLMVTCAYRDHDEYLTFFDDNKTLRLEGDTEKRVAGFGSLIANQSDGVDNLLKCFGKEKPMEEDAGDA